LCLQAHHAESGGESHRPDPTLEHAIIYGRVNVSEQEHQREAEVFDTLEGSRPALEIAVHIHEEAGCAGAAAMSPVQGHFRIPAGCFIWMPPVRAGRCLRGLGLWHEACRLIVGIPGVWRPCDMQFRPTCLGGSVLTPGEEEGKTS